MKERLFSVSVQCATASAGLRPLKSLQITAGLRSVKRFQIGRPTPVIKLAICWLEKHGEIEQNWRIKRWS
jgi:hypothetical protein